MFTRCLFFTLIISVSGMLMAADISDLKVSAAKINKAGSVAASLGKASKSKLTASEIKESFGRFGPEILSAAKVWAKDDELKDAPPAFRRFLFFEYLTRGTDITAGSSNPYDRLINIDADVYNLFDEERIADVASSNMVDEITEPHYSDLGGYLLASFPMMPEASKAKKCIECHASTEVERPYPEGARVLGYTFIALPK